jgi:hypothetical protein
LYVEASMARSRQHEARIAWERIEALGGHGVWGPDMVVVSLAGTGVTNDDLKLFESFPHIQVLDLSRTAVGDHGLSHLAKLPALEELIVVDTQISEGAIERFRSSHPTVKVTTQPRPKHTINPFTGKPL